MLEKTHVTDKMISAAIRNRRRELGITQEELAESIGVTPRQVQRYESGRNGTDLAVLRQIAHVLAAPMMFFFRQGRLEDTSAWGVELTPEERHFLNDFRKIKDNKVREFLVNLLEA